MICSKISNLRMNLNHHSNESPGAINGPAFIPLIKLLATGLMLALFVLMGQFFDKHHPTFTSNDLLYGLAFIVSVWFYYWIMVSRTTVSETEIMQTWCWSKKVRIADLEKIKFICIPGLTWLIAPRLVCVSGMNTTVFYMGHRELVRACYRLAEQTQ